MGTYHHVVSCCLWLLQWHSQPQAMAVTKRPLAVLSPLNLPCHCFNFPQHLKKLAGFAPPLVFSTMSMLNQLLQVSYRSFFCPASASWKSSKPSTSVGGICWWGRNYQTWAGTGSAMMTGHFFGPFMWNIRSFDTLTWTEYPPCFFHYNNDLAYWLMF